MSKYQQKDGDIVIYENIDKKSEKSPDFSGKAMIDGNEYKVSFWLKKPGMYTGKISLKQDEGYRPDFNQAKGAAQQGSIPGHGEGFIPGFDDSEIPF